MCTTKKTTLVLLIAIMGLFPAVATAGILDGLVTHYEFNDATTEADLGDNSATAATDALGGAGTMTQTTGPGIGIPNAADFGSNGRHIVVGGGPVVGNGDATVSAWFKTTATGFMDAIAGKDSWSANYDMMFYEFGGGSPADAPGAWLFDNYTGGAGVNAWHSAALNDGNWHHMAYVWIGGATDEVSVYVDGTLSAQAANADALGDLNTLVWAVGARRDGDGNGGLAYDGEMADVRIYGRALTDGDVGVGVVAGGEIADLYALSEVPEPSTFVLGMMGLLGLSMFTRRRRKK